MSETTLDEYVASFIQNSNRAFKNGTIQIIMLWSETCGHCHAQFKYWMRPLSHSPGNEGMGLDVVEYSRYLYILDIFGDESTAWDVYQRSDMAAVTNKLATIYRAENKAAGNTLDNTTIRAKAERAVKKLMGGGYRPLTKAALVNIEMIANRILPIETTSPIGKKIILEAQTFAEEVKTFNSPLLKKPQDYEIRFTPTWVDLYTHENYGYGHHSEKQLKDMLNINNLNSRRERFKALHSQVMNQECDAVACGLDNRVTKIDPKQTR